MNIANTCRALESSFVPFYHRISRINFASLQDMNAFLRACRPLQRESIRNVYVRWPPADADFAHDAWDVLSSCVRLTRLTLFAPYMRLDLPGVWMLRQIRGLSDVSIQPEEQPYRVQLERGTRSE